MRHVTGYTRKQDRQLFDKRRPWAPGKGPPKPPSTLYPGSNVRILTNLPQWAFGPNAPPVWPGPIERPRPQKQPSEPAIEPLQTGEPGTPEVDSKQLNQTKEIVALDSGEQTTVEPIPPQLEEDDTKKEMIEEPSFTPPEESGETGLTEAPPEPDTKPRIPIRITFHDGKNTRRKRKGPISLNYHSVRCSICNHPDRDAIEQGYLHWENPTYLAHEYGLGRRRAVYRHAEALGLRKKRGERTRRSLEFVMEQAEGTTATASDVIRAVKAYSCLSEDGQWTEPTKRAIITHEHVDGSSAPGSGPKLATRHSPLVTEFDGHAGPSKNAATPAPSTKVRKLMGTLFTNFGTKRR